MDFQTILRLDGGVMTFSPIYNSCHICPSFNIYASLCSPRRVLQALPVWTLSINNLLHYGSPKLIFLKKNFFSVQKSDKCRCKKFLTKFIKKIFRPVFPLLTLYIHAKLQPSISNSCGARLGLQKRLWKFRGVPPLCTAFHGGRSQKWRLRALSPPNSE